MRAEGMLIAVPGCDSGLKHELNVPFDQRERVVRKFLIISTYAPPAISGAPLMAFNLLRYFPEDSFAILTSHVGLDDKAIESDSKLRAKYFFFDTPKLVTQPQKQEQFFLKCKTFIRRFSALKSLFHFLSLFYLPFNIVHRGKKIIEDAQIEHLFGFSDHGPALLAIYLLHKITKKRFSLHFYDLYYKNNFPWFFKAVAYFLEPRLFKSADGISVMCEPLAEYYQGKYHRDVTVLHNCVPLSSSYQPEPVPDHPEPFKVAYTGTIAWAQLQAVRNLVRAVEGISGSRITLYLYTPHEKRYLESQGLVESEKVVFARGLPQDMTAIQKSADILFVGLSFDTRYPLLINTSSPGKTCEYLISGRPILIHAPKESYIAKYARDRGFACVVDENDVEALKQGILKLISDKEYVSQITSNAWKTAIMSHNAKEMSNRLQQSLVW